MSKAEPRLPFTLADASRTEAELEANPELARVGQDTRLDNRVLDLRTPANNAIFRLQVSSCPIRRTGLTCSSSKTLEMKCSFPPLFLHLAPSKTVLEGQKAGAEMLQLCR